MAAPGGAIMEARALGLRFGAVEALKDVSIRIEAGSVHALIGPNGAGKSSLLNCLSGFYHPWTGAVLFEGRDISATRPPERARLGIARTFQGIQTYPSMTARENILTGFHAQMKGGVFSGLFRPRSAIRQEEEFATRAEEIIDFLELEQDRHRTVGDMSYGLRKRVDLGRALALAPKILVMDEPMAGMSPEEKGDLARFILDIRDHFGIPVVLVEHDMDVVMDISDRVSVLEFGHVIAEGTPTEVRSDARVIAAYLGGAPEAEAAA
ncbi:ABC transporter ATP-binding protein [Seohaeicola zhoushanensis]|uniref:ABC transporter ATP-binding protein n=1 Tax=Seohaeicola zhoushanensis TaxID=1569283 RepID=A0A8J3M9N0_9RHOB|nr:ABC transporter ATP-binding protein [Seohaeicola zhoushanensis]GHF60405.1 ABC transporter ATP-binding protein [Seohaeicola zhoushanensis]